MAPRHVYEACGLHPIAQVHMCAVCALHVRCMCTACALHVRCTCTAYKRTPSPTKVREAYSAVRLVAHALDLPALYALSEFDLRDHWEGPGELSPLGFCDALALKKVRK